MDGEGKLAWTRNVCTHTPIDRERLRIVLLFNSDRVIDLAVSFSACREAVRIRVTLRACVRGQLG